MAETYPQPKQIPPEAMDEIAEVENRFAATFMEFDDDNFIRQGTSIFLLAACPRWHMKTKTTLAYALSRLAANRPSIHPASTVAAQADNACLAELRRRAGIENATSDLTGIEHIWAEDLSKLDEDSFIESMGNIFSASAGENLPTNEETEEMTEVFGQIVTTLVHRQPLEFAAGFMFGPKTTIAWRMYSEELLRRAGVEDTSFRLQPDDLPEYGYVIKDTATE